MKTGRAFYEQIGTGQAPEFKTVAVTREAVVKGGRIIVETDDGENWTWRVSKNNRHPYSDRQSPDGVMGMACRAAEEAALACYRVHGLTPRSRSVKSGIQYLSGLGTQR